MVIISVDTPISGALNVQLFGRTFSYAPGPFAAARLTGAAVTPVTATWNVDRKIEIALGAPLNVAEPPKPISSYSREVAAAMDQSLANQAAAWFERFFRAQPEQISIGLLRSLCTR
jgi:lauroyl/myristoyl acyltransferase